jgi:galactokinase
MANPRSTFEAVFGAPAQVAARAPGRVNLIGEHTDYQDGFVLPIALRETTAVQLSPRADRIVRVFSADQPPERALASFEIGRERRAKAWIDYVQGVTYALGRAGHPVRGFDAHVVSAVPIGGGLSSSAALEVALLRALRTAFALDLDDVAVALCAHRAETEFVGAPVGVMDQMAASLGDHQRALFLDTRTLAWRRVALPDGVAIAVINSGVPHSHATGGYRTRRAEVEQAARALGVAALRDVAIEELPRLDALPEPLRRRARHVVTENQRVLDFVAAMARGDLPQLGRLLLASHASLRDDYEVSIPQIDLLVEIARAEPGVIGARLTGGGFGGSIVMLAEADCAAGAANAAARAYAARSGQTPSVLAGAEPPIVP